VLISPSHCMWSQTVLLMEGRVLGGSRESRESRGSWAGVPGQLWFIYAAPALCILVFFRVPVSSVSISSFLNCSASRLIHITSKIAKSLVDGMRNFSSFETT
jgi:hypothetical protein